MNTLQDLSGTTLPPKILIKIPKVVFPENHTCKRCQRTGHFSSTCRAKTNAKGKEIESDDGYDSRE